MKKIACVASGLNGETAQTRANELMMMMMNFIHVSMYLADANWEHNIKVK